MGVVRMTWRTADARIDEFETVLLLTIARANHDWELWTWAKPKDQALIDKERGTFSQSNQ